MSIHHYKVGEADDSIRPLTAVVLHGNNANQVISYTTIHDVNLDHTLGLGSLIDQDDLLLMMKDSLEESQLHEDLIDPRIIIDSPSYLVWHKKRFKENMWFRTGKSVKAYFVEWTPLVFFINKKTKVMSVFATATNSRPSMDTILYHAPLMNIDEEGVLCLGTASLTSHISSQAIDECESALIYSQFTHTNHENTIRAHGSDALHIKFWKQRDDKTSPSRVTAKNLIAKGSLSTVLERQSNR